MKIMKRNINFKLTIICFLCTLFVVACNSEDDDRIPVITGVRSVDAAKADSLFTEGERWQLIVLVGKNLDGAKEIYINDQKISFNSTYVTSTHVILSIPEKIVLVGEDPSLSAEIRLVTDRGIATFAFHVNCPSPYAVSYTAEWDGENSILPGQEITIKGENFYEIQHISLSNVNPLERDEDGNLIVPSIPVESYEITNYQVDDTHKMITAKMPEVILERGYLVIECYSGTTVLAFRSTKGHNPEILEITSDMPILGEPCTLFGNYFNDLVSIIIGSNEIIIPAKDLKVNETNDQLTFTLPKLPIKGERLILVTEEGRDTIPFYQISKVIVDFDNYGKFHWGTNQVSNESALHGPANHSGVYYGIEGTTGIGAGWWGPMYLGDGHVPDVPDGTLIENMEFRYECYMKYPYVDGMSCWFNLLDDHLYPFSGYKDRLTGNCEVDKWMSCSIPLSNFTSATTYGEVKSMLSFVYMHMCNEINAQPIGAYFDNFRVYVKP